MWKAPGRRWRRSADGAPRYPKVDILCRMTSISLIATIVLIGTAAALGADDFSAYSPGRTHRHVAEIEAVLAESADARVTLTFCPHLLPVKRGILSALYLRPRADAEALLGLAKAAG